MAPLAIPALPTRASEISDLAIGYQDVNLTGRMRRATTINGSLPAPTLHWQQGTTVTLDVTNRLEEMSSIHWHGLILPSNMDGVPGLSFDGIAPRQTFRYTFPVRQSGTYWYHSHSGFQEQTGVYGAIVIDPVNGDPHSPDRDYVIVLSDWSDESPSRVFSNLRKNSHFYNRNRRSLRDILRDYREKGIGDTLAEREMWNLMRMEDADISDVTGFTYTYLMNGNTPAAGFEALFSHHERVRLRFINAAAMTIFDVRIPGLKMTVVAADGQDIHPISVDDFRIGAAETVDVIVDMHHEAPHAIFAQAIDRSGYAIGHLTPAAGVHAEVPSMDPVPRLTHIDMGMGHHDHTRHGTGPAGSDHASHTTEATQDHSEHAGHTMPAHSEHAGTAMQSHDEHAGTGVPGRHDMKEGHPDHRNMRRAIPDYPVKHRATEFGPHVDMRAASPQYRLDDPGVGLRHLADEGRRVLTYADMVRLAPIVPREPTREIELHLTGNMERYLWSIDGIPYHDAEPLQWRLGERVRVTLVNDTMMNHPMHLHGMWSELETGAMHLPRKHTVVVQPGAKISYHVEVDAPGNCRFVACEVGPQACVEISSTTFGSSSQS